MIRHISKCALVSWFGAISLGLIYGGCIVRSASIEKLWIMGVIQISFVFSTVIALLITPLTVWAFKPGSVSIKWIAPLWLLLVIYCLAVTPKSAFFGLYGTLALTVIGMTSIRLLARYNTR